MQWHGLHGPNAGPVSFFGPPGGKVAVVSDASGMVGAGNFGRKLQATISDSPIS